MSTELRRSPRYTDFFPISLTVNRGGETVSGPYSARVTDISQHGIRLLMTRVMNESFHIFHSTREDDYLVLRLFFSLPENGDGISVDARPIWFDSTQMDDLKVFKMGIDFTTKPDSHILKKMNTLIQKK